MSIATVQAALRNDCPEMTIRKTDCGEYRVTFTMAAIMAAYPDMGRTDAIAKAESLAAYESDITAAYETAKAMARTGLTAQASVDAFVPMLRRDVASAPAVAPAPAPASKSVSITMGWRACLPMLLAVYTDGNVEGRKYALEELARMATIADSASNRESVA